MCDKQEWKTGPCTLTSKDGKSVLVGEIFSVGMRYFDFRVSGAGDSNSFLPTDWTPTYSLPTLPDKVGAVIECNGFRFMRAEGAPLVTWVASSSTTQWWRDDRSMAAYCASHGGFKILLEGN